MTSKPCEYKVIADCKTVILQEFIIQNELLT